MSEYINNQGYRVGQLSSMRKELVRGGKLQAHSKRNIVICLTPLDVFEVENEIFMG